MWPRRRSSSSGISTRFGRRPDRGFGFIRPDDGTADVFVHISAFEDQGLDVPPVGDRISYDLETDSRSGKARAVRPKAVR